MTMIITDLSKDHIQVKSVIGSDEDIASYAHICVYGQKGCELPKGEDDTEGTIRRLVSRGHTSPFEFAGMTFLIKCPIFVARQWMRHRTFRYLERSGRYCISTEEVYLPDELKSDKEAITLICSNLEKYTTLINQGVPKQEARIILPVGTYTEFLCQADLHNLLHFLRLRLHPAAQPEMRFYAQCVADKVKEHFSITWKYFNEYYLEKKND